MLREDTYRVTVTVGNRDLGTWDKMSGGEADSEETTYRPGGLAQQITLGGARTLGNVTVTKLYDEPMHQLWHWLSEQVGRADMVVTKQPLDADGNKWDRPIVYSGKLKSATPPDTDSEGSGAALGALEMTCRGGIA